VFFTKTWEYEATYENEVRQGAFNPEQFRRLKKEELTIDSPFGYRLHAIWIPGEGSDKTVIFSHGYTYSLFGSVKYLDIFLNLGYNILLYDHRYHGKSGGKNCTMGFREKDDLRSVTDWVFQKCGSDSFVVTHGESLGGATVLLHGAMDKRISAIIADCPYKSVWAQFQYKLMEIYKLPAFPFLHISDWFSPLFIGTRFSQISPQEAVKNIHCPVLFIHGDQDRYIPYQFSVDLYNQKSGQKRLYVAKGADHAQSCLIDRAAYGAQINQFLSEVESIKTHSIAAQKASS